MNILLILLLFLNLNVMFYNQSLAETRKTEITGLEIIQHNVPLYIGRPENILFEVKFTVNTAEPAILQKINLEFSGKSDLTAVSNVSAVILTGENALFGVANHIGEKTEITGIHTFEKGVNTIQFNFSANEAANLLSSFSLKEIGLSFKNEKPVKITSDQKYLYRPATILRRQRQDNCDTYRIPGLVTTSSGTLIAVYDNRYNNSKDLQENIDIGMSRSTDGGQTWEPMKVIMDMNEWGGRPEELNGIGDPCILYNYKTGTIWVAALWMSGATVKDMLWWASKPGMKPEETGQFMLVKSTDDGKTWSQPINITSQIKNPGWQLLLQGPGRGITMKDGTLVFPAQFKADLGEKALDGGQYTCHSTIVFSKDGGKTWQIGTGAKSNTTEAQVVELADGSLMLNMRDDRNRTDKGETNGRAVAVTTDSGKTWTEHASSNSALQEPNCMASIISADLEINGKTQQVLFFSNPDSKTERSHMTIKASVDGGLTWPKEYQVLLNSEIGYGYSCMTMVDSKTIGILYEGVKELYFQKIPVAEVLDLHTNNK
ncbi:MAG TPA: exo-alpha-sialidase [Draconibacterium sp.]|nr:exo-alpha-sialidase [Draconibacterium sp.]